LKNGLKKYLQAGQQPPASGVLPHIQHPGTLSFACLDQRSKLQVFNTCINTAGKLILTSGDPLFCRLNFEQLTVFNRQVCLSAN